MSPTDGFRLLQIADLTRLHRLRRIRRLPGLPSSNICLESMTGDLDDFSIESYLGSPAEREVPGIDLHSQVLHQLHMC